MAREAAPAGDPAEQDGWDEGTDEESEAEVSLDEFEDEARVKVERLLAQERASAEGRFTQARQQLQAFGLDVQEDGTPVIRDPQRVTNWAQPLSAQRPAPERPAPAPVVDDDEEIPDPLLDAGAHKKWLTKQVGRATEAQQKEVQQLRQMLVRREISDAARRVETLLPEYGMEGLAQHPEFTKMFREALATIDPAQWEDDLNLVSVAGMLAPHLKRTEGALRPNPQAQRQARAGVQRAGLAQVTPSRDVGKAATKPKEVSDFDRLAAERLGMRAEDVEALRDATGDAYRQTKARKR